MMTLFPCLFYSARHPTDSGSIKKLLWTPFPVCGREHRPEVRESDRDADWWGSCVYCQKDIFRWTWNTLESLRFETRTDKWMLALLSWIQTLIPQTFKNITSLVKRNGKRNSDHYLSNREMILDFICKIDFTTWVLKVRNFSGWGEKIHEADEIK